VLATCSASEPSQKHAACRQALAHVVSVAALVAAWGNVAERGDRSKRALYPTSRSCLSLAATITYRVRTWAHFVRPTAAWLSFGLMDGFCPESRRRRSRSNAIS